jgi:ribulokinase
LKYLLGIDFGTGGTKACLTDTAMNPLAYSFREYPIYTDKLDFSEHDPVLYWRCTCDNIHSCRAGLST